MAVGAALRTGRCGSGGLIAVFAAYLKMQIQTGVQGGGTFFHLFSQKGERLRHKKNCLRSTSLKLVKFHLIIFDLP